MEVDPDRPVLVDKYLDRADELDVDALCDKDGNVTICGIMQHIEQAGVHSGEPLFTRRQRAIEMALNIKVLHVSFCHNFLDSSK